MRTFLRIATTAVAVAAVFPFGMTSASAETVGEPAVAAAYYSFTTPAKNDAYPGDPGPYFNQANADRVAVNNLAVAVAVPNQSDKESFLRFDLLSVPQGATITKALVTLPLQPNDQENQSVAPDPAKVKACAAGEEGFAEVDAGAYDEKPSVDCKRLEAVATATPDGKAYSFDVTALATTWLTEINDGIAIVPATLTSPFQVVFRPGAEARINVEYTPGSVVTTDAPVPTVPVAPPVVQPGVGVAPPMDTGTTVAPPVAAAPQPTPAPTVAPKPKVAQQPITNAAGAGGLVEHNGLDAGFWLAALVGVVVIGAVSLVLGAPEVPVRSSSVQNGVGRALDERRRAAGRTGIRPTTRPIPTA